ncbi:MAG: helix-turn-helix domain-containing protein [Proteobacteria bacterium]|nr:helix-turn-helix domain-containing protein [Pseudomonadota bacterium]NIS72308.1 helix-turn-helix domain-containing protein [Pseudomonadota bacterium]
MRPPAQKVNSIDKALTILLSFSPYNQEMGTIEISQKLGFHKATVSRILRTLTRHGFVIRNSQTKKFVLGPSVTDLARAVKQSLKTNLVQIAKPFIDDLRDTLKETVVLEVLAGESTFMAYIAEGPRLVRLAGSIGDRLPIHAAAGAKAILAFSPPELRNSLLDVKLHRFTNRTITDPLMLRGQLKEIKIQGVAFDHEEIDDGTSALGAPIFNHEEIPVAAVVVAGPSQRITWKSDTGMVSALKETTAKISAQLHYKKAPPVVKL